MGGRLWLCDGIELLERDAGIIDHSQRVMCELLFQLSVVTNT